MNLILIGYVGAGLLVSFYTWWSYKSQILALFEKEAIMQNANHSRVMLAYNSFYIVVIALWPIFLLLNYNGAMFDEESI